MKKVITALANPMLNIELGKQSNIEIIGSDIYYQDGIFEILEKKLDIDYLIISELLEGILKIEELIDKIKLINSKIKIIIILEESKYELENLLYSKGIYKILYNNEVNIQYIIDLIFQKDEFDNSKLQEEINNLKKIIIENKNINTDNNYDKKENKQNIMRYFMKEKISRGKQRLKEENEIISVSGPSGVGKSIICINLAKAMAYKNNKVLIIDFDILNNSLHTILGVKNYPQKIKEKIKNNIDKKEIQIQDLIIKINKKIDLISATELLFDSERKLNIYNFKKMLQKMKEEYNAIIIDTSSECFFDFTKTVIQASNKNIFVTEANILEIKKAKNLLNIYINEWKIDKNKFNILFNKYNENAINFNLLKSIFGEFKIIGILKYNSKYNKLINKNIKNNFLDKKIRKDYININENIKNGRKFYNI